MYIHKRPKRLFWFRTLLIRNKITLIYLPLIIVPLLILGLTANQIYSEAIVEKTVKNVSDNSSLIITQINGILTNAKSTANMLTLNLNKVIVDDQAGSLGQASDLQLYTKITNQLRFSLIVFNDVESVAFVDHENRVYGSSILVEANAEKVVNSELLQQLEQSNGKNIWFQVQRRDYLVTNSKEAVLTLGKKIVDINTGTLLGYLFVNVRESTLSSVYENIGSIKEGSYFIADDKGLVVSAQDPSYVLQPIVEPALHDWVIDHSSTTDIQVTKEGKMLLISTDIQNFNWKLISIVPYDLLTEDTRKITKLIFLIGVVCFIFALVGARLLSNVIAKPIVQLSRHMKRIKEGNLDQHIEVTSTDEIGLLAAGFNTMMGRIQGLLAKIGAEQRKKREYELALMQAQIKPHFLYNTLDVIYTLSEMGRAKDVQRTTKALADFYRVTLSKGRDQITLDDELRSIKDYLLIQRIRYSDIFNFDIAIDPNILAGKIPKLTIQPLVENAIYHGLKHKASFGQLTITGKKEDQRIIIVVTDDGAGMSEDRLQELKRSMSDQQLQVGYGLTSVHERIKLYFGERYGVQIESKEGIGTVVTVVIPYQAD